MTSGSQKRKTSARIAVNCTPAQKAKIVTRADEVGLSPSAICLAMMLDAPLPKGHHRRTIKDEALNAYLGAAQKLTDALKASVAELRKSGSNLNQIARMLNTDTAPARIMNIVESAIEEHRVLEQRHNEIFADLEEIRTVAMEVWGLEH